MRQVARAVVRIAIIVSEGVHRLKKTHLLLSVCADQYNFYTSACENCFPSLHLLYYIHLVHDADKHSLFALNCPISSDILFQTSDVSVAFCQTQQPVFQASLKKDSVWGLIRFFHPKCEKRDCVQERGMGYSSNYCTEQTCKKRTNFTGHNKTSRSHQDLET